MFRKSSCPPTKNLNKISIDITQFSNKNGLGNAIYKMLATVSMNLNFLQFYFLFNSSSRQTYKKALKIPHHRYFVRRVPTGLDNYAENPTMRTTHYKKLLLIRHKPEIPKSILSKMFFDHLLHWFEFSSFGKFRSYWMPQIYGLVQERRYSIANALTLRPSCIDPLKGHGMDLDYARLEFKIDLAKAPLRNRRVTMRLPSGGQ